MLENISSILQPLCYKINYLLNLAMAQCVDYLCGARFAGMVVIFGISVSGINFTSNAQQAVDTTVYAVEA